MGKPFGYGNNLIDRDYRQPSPTEAAYASTDAVHRLNVGGLVDDESTGLRYSRPSSKDGLLEEDPELKNGFESQ